MYLQVSLSGVCYTSLVPTNVTLYYWYTGVYNFFQVKILLIVYVYLTLYYTMSCKYTR